MKPMAPSDIQLFLKKLQADIDAGKNLLSESVATSQEFTKTTERIKPTMTMMEEDTYMAVAPTTSFKEVVPEKKASAKTFEYMTPASTKDPE